jgi:hypothetical protein
MIPCMGFPGGHSLWCALEGNRWELCNEGGILEGFLLRGFAGVGPLGVPHVCPLWGQWGPQSGIPWVSHAGGYLELVPLRVSLGGVTLDGFNWRGSPCGIPLYTAHWWGCI